MQYSKASLPMEVTESGIVNEVRLEQPEKVLSPIVVTEAEIVNAVRLLHL